MRFVVGMLLVGAAILKAVGLIIEPKALLATDYGRFLTPLQIAAELGLGLFAFSGLYWRQMRWLAVLLFTAFAGYSFQLAVSGAASCGCFGPLKINPWWTFALDTAVVIGLFVSSISHQERTAYIAGRSQLAYAMLLIGVSFTTAIALSWHLAPREASALSTIGDLAILEPDQWIGKPFPIADFIDADLSSGEWVVVLHRHDCHDCQAALPHYEELASNGDRPVALVEVPPHGPSHQVESKCLLARLNNDREWFVQTPVEIRLEEGVVVSASTQLGMLAGSDR